jgi:heme/copper-type cytochrome/quinol oxidase subunit 3
MTTIEPQSPELVPQNLAAGVRLWAGATTFFFFCPLFAYFYLRSLNSAGQWRPAGVDPPQGLGATVMAVAVVSSVVLLLASRPGRESTWRSLVALSLVLGLAGFALQCVAYAGLGFGPTDGGYASVYVAWTTLNALFVLGTMIWLETLLAYGLRSRDSLPLVRPRLGPLAFYWTYLAGLGIVMWVVLYLA